MTFACRFFSVSSEEFKSYEEAYPGVPVEVELKKMACWLHAKSGREKKNYPKFIVNWLSRVHGRLQEAEVSALVRVSHKREQERTDSAVGLWEGYRK